MDERDSGFELYGFSTSQEDYPMATETKATAEKGAKATRAEETGAKKGARGGLGIRTRADEVPASAATVKDAVNADEDRVGVPTHGPTPPLFVDAMGEHEETGRPQALVESGDGGRHVWPPQPTPDRRQTIGPDGTVTYDEGE